MLSSEAKTLSSHRTEMVSKTLRSRLRCHASVFASLDALSSIELRRRPWDQSAATASGAAKVIAAARTLTSEYSGHDRRSVAGFYWRQRAADSRS